MRQRITLPYGRQSISFLAPDTGTVEIFAPVHVAASSDPRLAVDAALDAPLDTPRVEEVVHPGEECTILVDDYTRITPVYQVLPGLIGRLKRAGITDEKITILVSTGTHRQGTDEELRDKLGEAYGHYRVLQHDCHDRENQVYLGLTAYGTPVWVNRRVVETDRLFGIGHVDPSTFAGYAGGRKLIVPGMAALETIDANHTLVPLGFRNHASLEVPCRKDINEAGSMVRADLFINVVLNQDAKISKAFAGSPEAAFQAGVALARQVYEVPYEAKVDIAVASGFPYDIDYYQACRAIQFTDDIVREGGSIVLVAQCLDGIGSDEFFHLLASNLGKPDAFLRNIARRTGKVTFNALGYILTRVLMDKTVYAYTEGIPDRELRDIGLVPMHSLDEDLMSLAGKYGPGARIGIFPVGSACVPVHRKVAERVSQ